MVGRFPERSRDRPLPGTHTRNHIVDVRYSSSVGPGGVRYLLSIEQLLVAGHLAEAVRVHLPCGPFGQEQVVDRHLEEIAISSGTASNSTVPTGSIVTE